MLNALIKTVFNKTLIIGTFGMHCAILTLIDILKYKVNVCHHNFIASLKINYMVSLTYRQ